MKSVFIINGFLESGKTEFIKFTMQQEYFRIKGKTMILLCEEGEVEYDDALLKQTNSVVEVIEKKEDLLGSTLLNLEKKHKPDRIIIEYNGMWPMANLKLPWHWKVNQQITIINAATWPMYYTNMRSLIGDMVRKSEMIMFNRCDGIKDLASYKRNMRALNRDAEIIFEDSNGEVTATMEEELPFDVKKDRIDLTEATYGIWFFDMLDTPDRYEGKTVSFLAHVAKPAGFHEGCFVPGRHAMTCCAEDIAFLGFVAKYEKASEIKDGNWYNVTATVKHEYWADYKGVGPVLYIDEITPANAPKEEIINLV
ncbi:MAG: GTPase [Lachnospiraceae bacterium]|jgi:Predicted membrane protein|nr:GTPase [Lachnospiraceae bacterium]